jgi:proteasome lid subunit RPN8/RPN11
MSKKDRGADRPSHFPHPAKINIFLNSFHSHPHVYPSNADLLSLIHQAPRKPGKSLTLVLGETNELPQEYRAVDGAEEVGAL